MENIKKCPKDIAKRSYSFRNSYDSLPRKDQQKLRDDLQLALQYKTIRTFYQRCNGATIISAVEKEVIESILKQYGIKWDYELEADKPGVPGR